MNENACPPVKGVNKQALKAILNRDFGPDPARDARVDAATTEGECFHIWHQAKVTHPQFLADLQVARHLASLPITTTWRRPSRSVVFWRRVRSFLRRLVPKFHAA